MYRGFNVKIQENLSKDFYERGLEIYNGHKASLRKILDSFMLNNQSLSGTKIMDNWFPQIDTHIFLSHSHAEEKKAIILAGILKEKLGIKTFIDSCIWGYSTDLLKQIDEDYCLNPGKKTYNYTKRNYSNSHVNLMLSIALNRMIDNCECIFFLNSPSSISSSDVVSRTKSPWIFSEIAMTQIVRKKTPDRLKPKIRLFAKSGQLNENERKTLTIEYDLELSHLTEFTYTDLKKWLQMDSRFAIDALDNLYNLKPLKENLLIYGQ